MPKAVRNSITPKRNPPTAPHDFVPMPASTQGWRQCERVTRMAFAVLESDPHLLPEASREFADSFADASIALREMSLLCSGAHARIIAATIRAGQTGARSKQATAVSRPPHRKAA